MRIESLKIHQVVWHRAARAPGGSSVRIPRSVPITILAIDTVRRRVLASWCSNPPRWYGNEVLKVWRISRPRRKPPRLGRGPVNDQMVRLRVWPFHMLGISRMSVHRILKTGEAAAK